jgi:hypothetical protein
MTAFVEYANENKASAAARLDPAVALKVFLISD